ncbi:cupin domain-containing protein [Saccharicrinis sp. FJH2]|uniref:cupin domain-containing protein n=1 Tax=Saccharicrinis sp. FJH65 TaxID=3344659 RepID=UPI0035F43C97
MTTIIKPDTLDFGVDSETLNDFRLKTLTPRLSEIANSKHFKFDIRQLVPGKYSFPYHFHRNAEELIMVLSGSMTLRTKDGLNVVNKGEIIFFEMGETSAHQFFNHDNVPCTYLDLRTTVGIDVVEYPDSGKINISPYGEIFEKSSQVGYNKGEEKVGEVWRELQHKHK